MNIDTLVQTMDGLGLLDLGDDPRQGDRLDGVDVLEIEWSLAEPSPTRGTLAPANSNERWDHVFVTLREQAAASRGVPPPPLFDALAWYLPIHYWGHEYGIYIHESAILSLACSILDEVEIRLRSDPDVLFGVLRSALTILYLHEAFHHRVESFAIRLEIIEKARRYRPYDVTVFKPLLHTDRVLEEALACAEFYQRQTEPSYRQNVPDVVRKAALRFVDRWFPTLPPSYRQARNYQSAVEYTKGANRLFSQVQEAAVDAARNALDWNSAPHIDHVLFSNRTITHVVVPLGQQPMIPWFDRDARFVAVSTRDLTRALERHGFEVFRDRGKGSHLVLKKVGHPQITLPANRESLGLEVLHSVTASLGLRGQKALAQYIADARSLSRA